MKLEDQVCNLELSKRLKELEVNQESLWYWKFMEKAKLTNDYRKSHQNRIVRKDEIIPNGIPSYCSAFTVAELGEMLPYSIKTEHSEYFLRTQKGASTWNLRYCSYSNGKYHTYGKDSNYYDTEANARAKMLIYLIENKLIEINNVLR